MNISIDLKRWSFKPDTYFLLGILIITFIQGLLFLFLVPPGQHYDEPGNFDYVWLVANRPSWPKIGDYDQGMRKELVTLLIRTKFFRGTKMGVPSTNPADGPIWVGYSQVGDPPLYYFLASLPLRIFQKSSIEIQLYLARGVSLIFYLLTVLFAALAVREMTPPGHPLRWMVPVFLALLPGFADLMTAVNNDAAAIAMFTLWLWLGVRVLRNPTNWVSVLLLLVATLLCFLAKKTVWVAMPLLLPLFILAYLKHYWRWIGLTSLVVVGIGALLIIFPWKDAAEWFRFTSQLIPTRVDTSILPFTKNAIQLQVQNGPAREAIYQLLGPGDQQLLKGKQVTIGAWMWANQETSAQAAGLSYLDAKQQEHLLTRTVQIGKTPEFVATQLRVPEDFSRLSLLLDPGDNASGTQPIVCYSGIVLAEGDFNPNISPVFSTQDGKMGAWDEKPFTNLARNALLSNGWPYPRPEFVQLFSSRINLGPIELTQVVDTLLDIRYTSWYFRATAQQVFQTFWAKFGWAQVRLWHWRAYYLLLLFTGIGLVGALIVGVRKRHRLLQTTNILIGISLIGVITFAVLYNLVYVSSIFHAYIPVARYVYPVILPIALILNLGWLEIAGDICSRWRTVSPQRLASVFVILLLFLDIYSFLSIWRYFA